MWQAHDEIRAALPGRGQSHARLHTGSPGLMRRGDERGMFGLCYRDCDWTPTQSRLMDLVYERLEAWEMEVHVHGNRRGVGVSE